MKQDRFALGVTYGLIACLFSFAAAARAAEVPMAHRVAEAYGIKHFDQVEAIKYTFNVQKGDLHVKRAWTWEPIARRVTFHGKGASGDTVTYTYNQNEVDTTNVDMKFVDPRFVNDQYWFLFPFHLAWDTNATIVDAGQDSLPMSRGMARHLVITYPGAGGYSPGDVYELFVGADDHIMQWIFRAGGSTEDKDIWMWSENRKLGPITVATDHLSQDGSVRLYFTDVAVRLKGQDHWVTE